MSSSSSSSSSSPSASEGKTHLLLDGGSRMMNQLLDLFSSSKNKVEISDNNRALVLASLVDCSKGKLFLIPSGRYFPLSIEEEMKKIASTYLYEDSEHDRLIESLSKNLSYLTESSPHWRVNWQTLKAFLSKDNEKYTQKLLENEARSFNIKLLRSWSRVLKEVSLPASSAHFSSLADTREKELVAKNSLSHDDVQKQLLEEARFSLMTPNKGTPEAPYSSISLNNQDCSNIISKLGKVYDLSKLIDNTDKLVVKKLIFIHRELTKALIAAGIKLSADFKFAAKPSKSQLAKIIGNSAALSSNTSKIASILSLPIPEKERDCKKLIDTVIDALLLKKDYVMMEMKADVPIDEKALRLDPWQAEMVRIIKEGASLLVVGPTSGGKTFTSMVTVDWIVGRFSAKGPDHGTQPRAPAHSPDSLLYVAPTFHLALQTYSNITRSFPSRRAALVTGIINSIPSNTTAGMIWVGTPNELLTYFESVGGRAVHIPTIGIFDEVHTISDVSTKDKRESDRIGSHCTVKLMEICTKQLIALSATISDADAKRLCTYFEEIGKRKVELILYRDRIIPLTFHVYNGDDVKEETRIHDTIIPVTPDSTLTLLKKMQKNKLFPVLFFDEDDGQCLTNFKELIATLQEREEREYADWHWFSDNFTKDLEEYNEKILDLQARADSLPSNFVETHIFQLRVGIKKKLGWAMRQLTDDNVLNPDYQAELLLLKKAVDTSNDFELLPIICRGVGPAFRFSEQSSEFSRFRKMQHAPQNSEDEKIHTLMNTLLKAEGLGPEDMKLVRLCIFGLSFGMGIILPSMPFFIQYEILRLLDTGKLNVVFGAQSFHMGVNYPLRSVVIRQNARTDIDIATALQMGGRCGRRRLDTEGHVIYWNVSNIKSIKTENLPAMRLPHLSKLITSRIPDHLETMINIEFSRSLLGGADLSSPKGKIDFLEAISGPIGEAINITRMHILLERIHSLLSKKSSAELAKDSYIWSERIGDFERVIAELHLRYHTCSNVELLSSLKQVGVTLRSLMYRQIFAV